MHCFVKPKRSLKAPRKLRLNKLNDLTQILNAPGKAMRVRRTSCCPSLTKNCANWPRKRWHRKPRGRRSRRPRSFTSAWLCLAKDDKRHWNHRTHFFAAAAEAMRRILVDNAQRKRAQRHGG